MLLKIITYCYYFISFDHLDDSKINFLFVANS